MISIRECPLFTHEIEDADTLQIEAGASYLYGVTTEPRSKFAIDLRHRSHNVRFVEIRETDFGVFETDLVNHERIVTRRRDRIDRFVAAIGAGPIYLDITGIGHATWAPLVKVCLDAELPLRVVYLEPDAYNANPMPDAGGIFDLSERIEGIAPIPLFASLEDKPDSETCFVALLGFEGTRFLHMLNEVQPLTEKIFPIIGVPGFRPHYPLHAYVGNAIPLEKYKSSRNLQLARSNCPFSLYYTLELIEQRFPMDQIKVGLIGTKPHALGAILFAISRSSNVEIIYDHVRRKVGRTNGIARCLIYGVSDFLPASRR